MRVFALDAKGHWFPALEIAMKRVGGSASRVESWDGGDGFGFVRPSPHPETLRKHQGIYRELARKLKMVQDADHIEHYEDKSKQFALYSKWMPQTWRFTTLDSALEMLEQATYPLVSKANEGSSSRNVRVLYSVDEATRLARAIFNGGIPVDLGHSDGRQQGYMLLQEFIPHRITYRVNAIGSGRAIFFRYCHPDKPLAQTGNVEPCDVLDDEMESLLAWSDAFFEDARTKWAGIDVLKQGDTWKLLETSLAWPWPSPGRCNEGPIFRTRHRWLGMFDVLAEDIARGYFG
jgi:glutathione synthase/RimK-type ligase-like ATP-grasp enzyme